MKCRIIDDEIVMNVELIQYNAVSCGIIARQAVYV
jgi:hypothetical protein